MDHVITSSGLWIKHRLEDDLFKLPELCILSYFPSLYQYIQNQFHPQKIDRLHKKHPYLVFEYQNRQVAFIFPGFGAPVSSMILDETITLGVKKLIVTGTCGSLLSIDETPSVFIISKAYSDEGTSRHYDDNDSHYMNANDDLINTITEFIQKLNVTYYVGTIWTTDAPYRETSDKIKAMKNKNCLAVDMEMSALYSVASFYKKSIAGLLIPKDIVLDNQWHISPDLKVLKPVDLFHVALDTLVK